MLGKLTWCTLINVKSNHGLQLARLGVTYDHVKRISVQVPKKVEGWLRFTASHVYNTVGDTTDWSDPDTSRQLATCKRVVAHHQQQRARAREVETEATAVRTT